MISTLAVRAEDEGREQQRGRDDPCRHLDGLLHRTVYPTVPPKVEYSLTGMAKELYGTLKSLTDWAERHRVDISAARAAYDATVA